MKNIKVFLLYVAAVFLCIHNFIPHNHAEPVVVESAAHHHGDGQQHEHQKPAGDDQPESSDPVELPSHQENLAKYIIKHHSEETEFAPEFQFHIPGVFAVNQADPNTLSYLPPTRRFALDWRYLRISSSYLRGPPSFIAS